MARTRRQAVPQPDPAPSPPRVEAYPDEASSGDESNIRAEGAPPMRRDAYDVATLRPSQEERPALFLDKKRRAATAHLDNSPSEAKRHRREAAINSSVSKRGRLGASKSVNPVLLDVMTKPNPRPSRPRNMRPITVELRQNGSRSLIAPSVPQTASVQEGQAGDDDHQSGVELGPEMPSVEVEAEAIDAEEAEEVVAAGVLKRNRALPRTVDSRSVPSRSEAARSSQPVVADVPPRCGQGDTRQEPAMQSPRRKRPKRRVKVPFGERPTPEITASRVSKSISTASQQRPRRGNAHEGSSQTGHLKELFANDMSPARRTVIKETIVFAHDDSSNDDDDVYEVPESSTRAPARGSQSHHKSAQEAQSNAPSTSEAQFTVPVPSKDVRSMCFLMGKAGWTANRKSWIRDLSDPRALVDSGLPATPEGKECLKLLLSARNIYRGAPSIRDPSRQNGFLQKNSEKTETAMARIHELVDSVCGIFMAAGRAADGVIEERRQKAVEQDLVDCIIPLLVLLLREFFFLGGASVDADGERTLPDREGTFTVLTLNLLKRTSGWIRRLAEVIRRETELRGIETSSDDGDPNSEHPKSASKRHPSIRQQRAEKKARERVNLDEIVRRFSRTLKEASARLEEAASKETRIRARAERAAELKVEKERQEQEEEEKRRKRFEAMCLSTQQLRKAPDPVSQMWFDRLEAEEKRRRELAEIAERERMGSPQLGAFFEESSREYSAPPDRRAPLEREERRELLGLVKEHYANPDYVAWARSFGRDLDIIRGEVKYLKVACKNEARARRKQVPDWAQSEM